jgi:hypothetical protein
MSTFESSEDALRDLRENDEGELVGKDPRKVSPEILALYHSEKKSTEGHSGTLPRLLLRSGFGGPQMYCG